MPPHSQAHKQGITPLNNEAWFCKFVSQLANTRDRVTQLMNVSGLTLSQPADEGNYSYPAYRPTVINTKCCCRSVLNALV